MVEAGVVDSSWKPIKNMKSMEESSFADIFGELSFKQNPNSAPSSPNRKSYYPANQTRRYRHSDSFSSMNSESLSLCTEGLGFESSDDVESIDGDWNQKNTNSNSVSNASCETKRSRMSYGDCKFGIGIQFPPPISCIGWSGKPLVCFKSYRRNGRFVLIEERIPVQEFLHSCREDGRLKMQFIPSDDEIFEDDEEEEEDFEENAERENEMSGKDGNGGEL